MQTKEVRGVGTSIRVENGTTIIRYHDTDVVKFNDRTIQLDTGGWKTATTKLRMNQAANQFNLRYHVSQYRGEWYVEFRNSDRIISFDDDTLLIDR